MKIGDALPSNYLKASDVSTDTTLIVSHYEIETIGQGKNAEDKPVIYFRGQKKGLVLNKTNANAIGALYGEELDDWIGKPVTIGASEVEFQGDMVQAIRVRTRKPAGNGAPAATTDHAAELKTALNIAWAEFQIANPGKSNEEVTPLWKKAIHSYFDGKPAQVLGSDQWKAFVRDKFVKQGPPPIEDAPIFTDECIPF